MTTKKIHRSPINAKALFASMEAARSVGPWWRSSLLGFDVAAFKPAPDDKVFVNGAKIRCPLCKWQPEHRHTWSCTSMGPPENFSGGCGHSWNTFDTAGLCPGCNHQWRHTTCFSCGKTTRHPDWYDKGGGPAGRK